MGWLFEDNWAYKYCLIVFDHGLGMKSIVQIVKEKLLEEVVQDINLLWKLIMCRKCDYVRVWTCETNYYVNPFAANT